MAETAGISIILADDHEIVRDGLRQIVETEGDMQVVAEVGDPAAARTRVSRLKPAILLLDLEMLGEPSLPSIAKLHESSPETAVVLLTMQEDPAFAQEALRLGAKACVAKHTAGTELADAIRAVAKGETYVNPRLVAGVAADRDGRPGRLTPREIEVLRLVVSGHTNAEIAEQLAISTRTVETHRASIHRKLGTSGRSELVSFAHEHGLDEDS